MSLLGRLLHHRLRDVQTPTRVTVRGALASPATAASPLTPVHAVLLRYELLRRVVATYRRTGRDEADPFDYRVAFTSPLLADATILVEAEDGVVSVPTAMLDVRFARRSRPEPLAGSVPAELAEQIARLEGEGELCYHEQFLLEGDRVELDACVQPTGLRDEPYRSGAGAAYVVCEPQAKLVELPAAIV